MALFDFKNKFRTLIAPYLVSIKSDIASSGGGGGSYVPNKIITQNWSDNVLLNNTTAVKIKSFPQVTIQAGKKIALEIGLIVRDSQISWGGLILNINCNVNGLGWKNLGNTGYNGGAMASSTYIIEKRFSKYYFDFITEYSLDPLLPYTVEFELYGATFMGSVEVNEIGDVNTESKSLNTRGVVENWNKLQNFSNLTILEIDNLIDNT